MATLTKSTGTVTLSGAVEKVTLPAVYGWVWVKNMSEGDIFAGLSEDISEGADGVMVIPSGECGRIQTDGFLSVYLLGSGNVQIVGQNYADCPFKAGAKGGELPVASTDTLGGVMVDGTSITADENGVIRAVGSGSDDWTNVGTVSIPGGNKATEFSIPNLSNYKFMMLSISVPSYSGSKWNSSNYTRILVLDDYRLPSDGGVLKYYIGDDATSTSSSSTVYQYVCSMTINKSTNKVIFFGQSSCYANIYMK